MASWFTSQSIRGLLLCGNKVSTTDTYDYTPFNVVKFFGR